ncbi:hypothetical protein HUB98_21215 [Paenibacillus barcinonensis]|uniref:Uncharacterized protein n=1 Tax=Paenibacillus barcinonensis TaxID=198119 RepID=A0ABX6Q9E7_PAEBA|nr:hypothetical protein [Paenibacillus barcinonensis]QKS58505.1 hypothetical protein HUB98_21215 [Paenibacillus barcinonensis]
MTHNQQWRLLPGCIPKDEPPLLIVQMYGKMLLNTTPVHLLVVALVH